jgi:hypothetical protein
VTVRPSDVGSTCHLGISERVRPIGLAPVDCRRRRVKTSKLGQVSPPATQQASRPAERTRACHKPHNLHPPSLSPGLFIPYSYFHQSINPSTQSIALAKVRKSDKALELPQKGPNPGHEASPRALRRTAAYGPSIPFEHASRTSCVCGQKFDHQGSSSRVEACL